jgi:hypothetical protein
MRDAEDGVPYDMRDAEDGVPYAICGTPRTASPTICGAPKTAACHSRAGGNPFSAGSWIPVFTGMTSLYSILKLA